MNGFEHTCRAILEERWASKLLEPTVEAISLAHQEAVRAAELKVWQYVAKTPEWQIPITNLDAAEPYKYYVTSYIPPKEYVNEMIVKLEANK